ncbi:alpha/beta-hydrolase [Lindgomyces ingoldianus]|uniref:Alpha/beta-hydrolase n=1 Tax=Lindgomyces ingoldianus TaxID=673940 RepID=A0ACB6RFG5_9PLEO|nr:alpha/beta-hydrolase [Lindgomyces ingoldianus]KAF2477237.1 alpha/beta-hydrolase [Lindgomyces ingoldianus]
MAFIKSSFRFLLSLSLSLYQITASITPNSSPLVTLDYGIFQGVYSTSYNLTHYRRIPFGASTAGPNRFRAPQPPLPVNGTYNTDRAFDMCPQRTVNGSEDCLYLGLYSRPWDGKTLRPVLVTFYGGGFIQGSASFTIPPSGFPVLNASQLNDYVVVYPNYRTNVFGFLAGAKLKGRTDVDFNPGLLDQQAALKWVQKYITRFGGDPANVTIWGQSAGGGSVVAQSIAKGNRGKGLFVKAMASSPYWPKTYRFDAPEIEELYEQVVEAGGCKSKDDEIGCLKSVDVQLLREISLKISAEHTYSTSSYTWGPVVSDGFLAESLSEVVRSGKLNVEMVMGSYNLHEGENFIPPGLASASGSGGFNSSTASFETMLKLFLPGFGENEVNEVKRLYPEMGTAEEIQWNTTYERAGMVYRDLVLACPAYWTAKTAKKGWLIEYTISPAKHASDTIYWNQVNAVQKSDTLIYEGYTGAMASFAQTGDPNAHKLTNVSTVGVPSVDENRQFVVRKSRLADVSISMLEKRCEFWLQQGSKIPV